MYNKEIDFSVCDISLVDKSGNETLIAKDYKTDFDQEDIDILNNKRELYREEQLKELLNLDGYKDFESPEDLADGYNKLRDIVKDYLRGGK